MRKPEVVVLALVFAACALGGWRGPADLTAARAETPVASPAIEIDGCRIACSVGKAKFGPGERVVLHVRAENPTRQSRALALTLRLTVMDPASMRSRMPVTPPPKVILTRTLKLDVPTGGLAEANVELEKAAPADGMPRTVVLFKKAKKPVVPAGKIVRLDPKLAPFVPSAALSYTVAVPAPKPEAKK